MSILNYITNNILYAKHNLSQDFIDVKKKKINKIKQFDDFIPTFARTLNIKYQYTINIKTKGIKINIYCDKLLSEEQLNNIKIYLQLFISTFTYKNYIQRIFYIGLYPNKRIFEYNNGLILKDNINGGATYKLNNKLHEIYIYRIEEFERLLVHELIHSYELDQLLFDIDINFFKELFGPNILNTERQSKLIPMIDIKPYLFEIFTQTFTIVLLSLKYNLEKKIKLDTSGSISLDNYHILIKKNRNHLLKICKSIQYETQKQGYYKEETSVLSYYFGVCILLFNIDMINDLIITYDYKKLNKNKFANEFKYILMKNKDYFVKELNKTKLVKIHSLTLSIFE